MKEKAKGGTQKKRLIWSKGDVKVIPPKKANSNPKKGTK